MKNQVESKKMYLQEGTLDEIFQLVKMSKNLVDISKMVREIAHPEMEDVILTIQSSHFLNVKSVLTNNHVVLSLFVSFTTQKDKRKMVLRQILETSQKSVDIQKVE